MSQDRQLWEFHLNAYRLDSYIITNLQFRDKLYYSSTNNELDGVSTNLHKKIKIAVQLS